MNQKLINETLTNLAQQTLDEERVAFEDQIMNTLNVCEQLKTSIDNRSRDYINFLTNGIECVSDLAENKYLNEEQSGFTPKRKSTSSDEAIQFTKTRSHTELLDLYRRRNQVEMIVTEEEFKEVCLKLFHFSRSFINCLINLFINQSHHHLHLLLNRLVRLQV